MRISYYQEICKSGSETDEIISWCYENFEEGTWQGKVTSNSHPSSGYYDRKMIKDLEHKLIVTTYYFQDEENAMAFKLRWT